MKEPKPELNFADAGVYFKDMEQLWRFCELIAQTRAIPEHYQNKPAECMACITYGLEIGVPAMSALKSIMVVNGVSSMWGDGLLARCQSSPFFDWNRWQERENGKAPKDIKDFSDDYGWTCVCARKNQRTPTVSTFTVAMAKRAGLWTHAKKLYGKYPERMLKMRARMFGLRDTFAPELGGMVSREEFEHQQLVNDAIEAVELPTDPAEIKEQLTKPGEEVEPGIYRQEVSAEETSELGSTKVGVEETNDVVQPSPVLEEVLADCKRLEDDLPPQVTSDTLKKCGFTSTIAVSKSTDLEKVLVYRNAMQKHASF
jgi:hypothetical protein